jgi:4-amino-4-deoxychorismate lyase
MFQFLESILIENGQAPLICYHQKRYEACLKEHYPKSIPVNLKEYVSNSPSISGKTKLRILYSDKIDSVEYIPYTIKNIDKLYIINSNEINYNWKYSDRTSLNQLKYNLPNNSEILIIKNGFVSDTSFSNVIFEKSGKLYTPNTPLLNGVRREFLLSKKEIEIITIKSDDIFLFDRIILINGLIGINELSITINNSSISHLIP